jgi:nickel/cobalt exporter
MRRLFKIRHPAYIPAMPDFLHTLQNGSPNLWLFIPTAILLGSLHGLEPGHSKTMMAAFIVAIRGTVGQAVLLGLSAAISHSLIIWVLAAGALHFGNQWNAERVEPYLQLVSAALILTLAAWMFFRTRREVRAAAGHGHTDNHHHDHSELFLFDTGHGKLELSVFEDGVPPVFRLRTPAGHKLPHPANVTIETVRPDGVRQTFPFVQKGTFLESRHDIPEPHEFDAVLTLGHGDHSHTCRVEFHEDAHHHYHHADDGSQEFQDAHELAHAQDIAKRFASRTVTTPQIMLFGITGGLMPCPAAFTVLLVCLQLKRATLGFAMVGAFSFGLALTMVAVGVIAAWSVQHAEKRFKGFGEFARRAPYISCILLVALALYMAWHGWHLLHAG